jgi:putative RecB family exonuclease
MTSVKLWKDAWKKETEGLDLTNARVAGRATKANPNREDSTWWNDQGPIWVEQYIMWRRNNPEWKIWTTAQGARAIELELNPVIAGVPVKMVIDRVFEVNGQLVIIDLKTSARRPTSDLQLGFYKVGIEQTLGVEVNLGNYWMSRDAGTGEMIDLSRYNLPMLEYMVSGFDKSRKAGVFLPNLSSCSFCGLTEHCEFTKEK